MFFMCVWVYVWKEYKICFYMCAFLFQYLTRSRGEICKPCCCLDGDGGLADKCLCMFCYPVVLARRYKEKRRAQARSMMSDREATWAARDAEAEQERKSIVSRQGYAEDAVMKLRKEQAGQYPITREMGSASGGEAAVHVPSPLEQLEMEMQQKGKDFVLAGFTVEHFREMRQKQMEVSGAMTGEEMRTPAVFPSVPWNPFAAPAASAPQQAPPERQGTGEEDGS